MGTTSQKLTYLNETKQELKQKINNLGGSIDDNTTFREYVEELQDIYDNLPKTEYQEGTEISLGKTSKGKLDFDNGVVGIGQSSQESTTGKNKFNVNDYSEYLAERLSSRTKTETGYTIETSSSATTSLYGRVVLDTTSFPDTQTVYKTTVDITSNVSGKIAFGWTSNSNIDTTTTITANVKTTITLNGKVGTYLTLGFYQPNAVVKFENIMVSVNGGDYEPYTRRTSLT